MVCIIRKKLSGLAALFEEASNCMLEMPGLVLPSIIASVLLALFLSFWIAVVVCLATANMPNSKSLFKHTTGNITEFASIPLPSLPIRNNTGIDHKIFEFIEYYDVRILQDMLWFYLFGLIWTCEFIFGRTMKDIHLLATIELIEIKLFIFSLSTIGFGCSGCILVFSKTN